MPVFNYLHIEPKTINALTCMMAIVLMSNIDVRANNEFPYVPEVETQMRMHQMTSIIEMRYTSEVESRVREYTVTHRHLTENILKDAFRYFPIIDKYLEELELPAELRYLAIVESKLDPKARSGAGALGMWQLMSPTAKDLGLRKYHSLDERMDIHKSSQAALKYMKRLHRQFGDWALAMAAYNCGAGRVLRAMEESGGSNYWQIRDYLPRETAKFIPEFIAASYVFRDYETYALKALRFHPDKHFTVKIDLIDHKVYLRDVARLLHVELDTLYELNPSYKKNYIPASPNGYNLVIPQRAYADAQLMIDTLEVNENVKLSDVEWLYDVQKTQSDSSQSMYYQFEFLTREGDYIGQIARQFNVEPNQLMYWNHLEHYGLNEINSIDIAIPYYVGKFNMVDYYPIKKAYPVEWTSSNTIVSDAGSTAIKAAAKSYISTLVDKEENIQTSFFMIRAGMSFDVDQNELNENERFFGPGALIQVSK